MRALPPGRRSLPGFRQSRNLWLRIEQQTEDRARIQVARVEESVYRTLEDLIDQIQGGIWPPFE